MQFRRIHYTYRYNRTPKRSSSITIAESVEHAGKVMVIKAKRKSPRVTCINFGDGKISIRTFGEEEIKQREIEADLKYSL